MAFAKLNSGDAKQSRKNTALRRQSAGTRLLGLGQMVEEDLEVLLGEAGHGKGVSPGGGRRFSMPFSARER